MSTEVTLKRLFTQVGDKVIVTDIDICQRVLPANVEFMGIEQVVQVDEAIGEVTLNGGQTLVELHLNHRILPDDSAPYSRKRRVKDTFIVHHHGRDIKFEVFARAIVLPEGRPTPRKARSTVFGGRFASKVG
jgi:hypothetical protein